MTISEYIDDLEKAGQLDPNCKMCKEIFYPEIKQGRKITDIFAPRHRVMETCKSGKYPHCTCDTCF